MLAPSFFFVYLVRLACCVLEDVIQESKVVISAICFNLRGSPWKSYVV